MQTSLIKEWAVEDDGGEEKGGKVVLSRYQEPLGHILRLDMTATPKGGGVFENRFTNDFMSAVNEAVDLAVKEKDAAGQGALVITSSGKIWSNGLHLDSLMKERQKYINSYLSTLRHMLVLPMPVIAACQGHTFAGGMLFALTCDMRVASSDKGFWCMPEIDLGLPLTIGMNAIIKEKIRDPQFQVRVMLEGPRLKAKELLDEGVVDVIAPASEVEKEAVKLAERMAKKSGSSAYGALKEALFQRSVDALGQETGRAKL